MLNIKVTIFALGVAACLIGAANAHFVWLERDEDGPARAYFGEFVEDLHEKTGGRLDTIQTPRAFTAAQEEILPIERRSDHFAITVKDRGDLRLRAVREEIK